jgi:hypothetical protein
MLLEMQRNASRAGIGAPGQKQGGGNMQRDFLLSTERNSYGHINCRRIVHQKGKLKVVAAVPDPIEDRGARARVHLAAG